jgi:tetratricopeptide (TPR) repeat protein
MIQSALVHKAIKAALTSEWDSAIAINEQLLSQFPQDLDCLNRLARAYFELGEIDRSKKIYKEVLELDPYNAIASKNLLRFGNIKEGTTLPKSKSVGTTKVMANFIEEPGKTKVIPLVRIAEPSVLAVLHAGDYVSLVTKQRGIHVFNDQNVYIGRLPDDLAFHLQYFITNGNQYDAYIKQVVSQSVYVFIRESFRSSVFASRPTFSISNDSYVLPASVGADTEKNEFDSSEEPEQEEEA